MLLAIDIGNTDITLGLYDRSDWLSVWRMPSDARQTEPQMAIQLRNHFLETERKETDIDKVVISSVVPALTTKVVTLVTELYRCKPVLLNADTFARLPIAILNPHQIGSDLVANALAAWTHAGGNCVVVDFGTALTFTVVNDNRIEGVAIAPGLRTSVKALSLNAAKLFEVPLEMPTSVLGKGTTHAMQAGLLFGYEGLVKGVVTRIRDELGQPQLPVYATGGLSSVITPLKDFYTVHNPHLTLDGLRISITYCS